MTFRERSTGMISTDRLLAEYVEARLDSYETRCCLYDNEYPPWAWICELSGGATEECVEAASNGDTIMNQAMELAQLSGTVREHAYLILKKRGITPVVERDRLEGDTDAESSGAANVEDPR